MIGCSSSFDFNFIIINVRQMPKIAIKNPRNLIQFVENSNDRWQIVNKSTAYLWVWLGGAIVIDAPRCWTKMPRCRNLKESLQTLEPSQLTE